GEIAIRAIQAGDECCRDRVEPGLEDDRDRRGCGLGSEYRRRAGRDDHGCTPVNQIGGERRQSIMLAVRVAIFDCHAAACDEAGFFQPPQERSHEVIVLFLRPRAEITNDWKCLLRARRERPRRRRAADEHDELASFHSITSSARSGNAGGMFNPSTRAVLRLTTSSYLVGACTGNSPGFCPRRMRST